MSNSKSAVSFEILRKIFYKPFGIWKMQEIKASVHEALSSIETVATKASSPWELDLPEYDTDVTEAIDWIDEALSKLEEL